MREDGQFIEAVFLRIRRLKPKESHFPLAQPGENIAFFSKDPFNRLPIVQTNIENGVLISCDSVFANYSVKVEW